MKLVVEGSLVFCCFLFLFIEIKAQNLKEDIRINFENNNSNKKSLFHLFRQWQNQTFNGLMAAIASKKITLASEEDATIHERCARAADSINTHAKCVSELLKKSFVVPFLRRRQNKYMKNLFSKLKPVKIPQATKLPLDRLSKYKLKRRKSSFKKTPMAKVYLNREANRFEQLSRRITSDRSKTTEFNPMTKPNLNAGVYDTDEHQPNEEAQKWRLKSTELKIGPFIVQN